MLFEDIQYGLTTNQPIRNELLLTEGDDLFVSVPDVDGILGDKLTAFAPHTTGIPFGVNKELEIIKQLFDCGSLFDVMSDFKEVCNSYDKIVRLEMGYRCLKLTSKEVLKDTIDGSLCIASRGQLGKEDYLYFKDGIFRIRNHILGGKFSGVIAGAYAGRVLYIAAAMLAGSESAVRIDDASAYSNQMIELPKPKSFSYLCVVDLIAYGYVVEAGRLLHEAGMTFSDI